MCVGSNTDTTNKNAIRMMLQDRVCHYAVNIIPARIPTENIHVSIFGATAVRTYPDEKASPEMQTAVLHPYLSAMELDNGPERWK